MSNTKPAPAPTHTNIFALVEATACGLRPVPARIESSAVPHLRRCLAAGLLIAGVGGSWDLTPAGFAAVLGYATANK